jgi:hypothetical protein
LNFTSLAGRTIARTAFDLPATRYVQTQQRAVAQRIVVFVDRSPEAPNAAWRGALVARERVIRAQRERDADRARGVDADT